MNAEDFATDDGVLQIGLPPRRIDILRQIFTLEGRKIRVIGREALIKTQRADGRPQDLADTQAIEPPRD